VNVFPFTAASLSRHVLPLAPAGFVVEQVLPSPDRLIIISRVRASAAACPVCDRPSVRVHSRYTRKLADLPWQGRHVHIHVRARRFHCGNATCARRIFAERLPGERGSRAQRTARLSDIQRHVALALGGAPGARLANRLGMPTSRDTLLRLVRRRPAEPIVTPRVIGVDDWAWRRGHRYGTILVDLEQRRIVDLLPDREADSFAAWLREHPGVEVIARDRGAGFADGGRRGAPDAVHVADRWHLLENCSAALLDVVRRHQPRLREAATQMREENAASGAEPPLTNASPAKPPPMTCAQKRQWEGWQRRLQRHQAVMEQHRRGVPIKQICRDLAISRKLVRRWVRGAIPELQRPRLDSLEAHRGFLESRWAEGCRNAARLWRELRETGWRGSQRVVGEWAARQRLATPAGRACHPAGAPFAIPSVRRTARMLATDLEKLAPSERRFIGQLLAASPQIAKARNLALRFAAIIRTHAADQIKPWLLEAKDSQLGSFALGLEQDAAAVHAALTLPWSSGQVEGQITRLKLIKRQTYGRAKLDLLQARLRKAA
jgi:transposase